MLRDDGFCEEGIKYLEVIEFAKSNKRWVRFNLLGNKKMGIENL